MISSDCISNTQGLVEDVYILELRFDQSLNSLFVNDVLLETLALTIRVQR